jgi:hypothetical protein
MPTSANQTLGHYDSFHPGAVWLDTDGVPIRAHSAGLLQPHTNTPSKYYWYGADNYTSGDGTNVWINVCVQPYPQHNIIST